MLRAVRVERLARRLAALSLKAADATGDTGVSAKALVFNEDGGLLLLKDADGPWWGLPGGRVKQGESLREGMEREVMEETGLRVTEAELVFDGVLDLGGPRRVAVFRVEVEDLGELRTSDESSQWAWVRPAALGDHGLGEYQRALATTGALHVEVLKAQDPEFEAHDRARRRAEAQYNEALTRVVAGMESAAISDAASSEDEDRKAAERRRDEDAWLLLLFLAALAAYKDATAGLSAAATPGPHMHPGVLAAVGSAPQAAREFAEGRRELLRPLVEETAEALRGTAAQARRDGLAAHEAAEQVRQAADEILSGRARRAAATEAQATYGDAMRRLLAAAGYTHKVWHTMEDERVRPTHAECGEQGPVEMGGVFANGLRFPGDPNGGPEEVCNCRCWLTGQGRRREAV